MKSFRAGHAAWKRFAVIFRYAFNFLFGVSHVNRHVCAEQLPEKLEANYYRQNHSWLSW